ncbi:antibiotic biosynthesis monooxygenase [Streptosporangium sp. NPDC023615]|uniref:antibiotic biosynthesis monooxygenase n=1 Tax=Streptosporangium sp. NPDC023615 TaxID=3154794 RepID=UPI00343813AC
MEVLVAVIAFAGALLAAIATGALVSRLRGEPKGWLIAWSITTASLSVSLAVIATGHLIGFGPGTFRIYQLTGSMLAPLWLAVGVIQLLARKSTARFASWLLGIALTVIAAVILAIDPILLEKDFAKTLPPGGTHWGLFATSLLLAVHVIVAVVLLGGTVLAALRNRGGDDYDADNLHALLVLGPTGLALVGAVSFAVPGMFTVLLFLVTAAAVWYVLLRPLAPYEDEDEDAADDDWENRPPTLRPPEREPRDVQVAGRRITPEEAPRAVAAEEVPRRSGLGDLVAEYRAGEQDVDYAARMRQQQPAPADDPFGGPATGMFMAGEYGMPLPGRPPGGDPGRRGGDHGAQPPVTGQFGMPPAGPSTGEYDIPANEFGRHGAPGSRSSAPGRSPGPATGEFGRPVGTGEFGMPPGPGAGGPGTGEFGRPAGSGEFGMPPGPGTGEFGRPAAPGDFGRPAGPGTGEFGGAGSLRPMPAEQAFGGAPAQGPGLGGPAGHDRSGSRGPGSPAGAPPSAGARYPGTTGPGGGLPGGGLPGGGLPGGPGRPSPGIFGMLTVFTLLDGTGERFDRLAEETVEAVRGSEPDTLVYSCHSVKSAPLQRIVYELYRDEVAYSEHQRRPHTERFVTERQSMVLATNVIELTLNAAKVMPLPTAFGP